MLHLIAFLCSLIVFANPGDAQTPRKHTVCVKSVKRMSIVLDSLTDSAETHLKPSAFPYADFLFDDDEEMFEELAYPDTGYTLKGVTFMWDRSDSVVYVARVRPALKRGRVCIDTYDAAVVRRYKDGMTLPEVRKYD